MPFALRDPEKQQMKLYDLCYMYTVLQKLKTAKVYKLRNATYNLHISKHTICYFLIFFKAEIQKKKKTNLHLCGV